MFFIFYNFNFLVKMDNNFQLESVGYLCNHMARLFAQLLGEALRPLGIAPAQFPILLELWQQEGLSQQELVARADLKQATMANTLARMERDGLIVRKEDENDGRIRLIMLTDRAKSLKKQAMDIAIEINKQALSIFSKAEQEMFISMMGKLIVQQQEMLRNKV